MSLSFGLSVVNLAIPAERQPDMMVTMAHHKTAIVPILSVRNGTKAIDFYKNAFGAEELFRVDDENGSVVALLSIDEAEFWVGDESPENANYSPESLGGGSVRMSLVVEDPYSAFERAVKAGATEVRPITDEPYGWRIGRIADPFGHHWEIGKPLEQNA